MPHKIAIIGLGYVGLPLALAMGEKFPGTIGFDINANKVSELRRGLDKTGETEKHKLQESSMDFTSDPELLSDRDFFIVAVPTPIDKTRKPDLKPLKKASETISKILKRGSIVVYESTVYPGVTEEICGPILELGSGLKQGVDFKLGYSPERINPGDKIHTLENIVKVVSGEDNQTCDVIASIYGAVVKAGIHKASSIMVAEAAKVIENTQRDLNIALMNELAIIFDKMGIHSADVLEAASTKWNFLKFSPGLVGGHCIGIDPYYLTFKAEELGYHPEIILAGRRINDSMGKFIAQKTLKAMAKKGINITSSKVGILGITFKENVPDTRNSKVPDIIHELQDYGANVIVHDPLAEPEEVKKHYRIELSKLESFKSLNAVILAVNHSFYLNRGLGHITEMLNSDNCVFFDVKSCFSDIVKQMKLGYLSL